MTRGVLFFSGLCGGRSLLGLIAAAICLATVPVVHPALAQYETQSVTADAISPVEEFSRQLDEFKKTIPELNKKIEDSAASVDRWTDAAKARSEIEELRALVGAALGAVSDNGPVSQMGARALDHARD